ncbi:MAG: HIRAN domain-containing protein [Treponema sp.]|nr:HIRAN domain-containing protein [Treponema sp.]
MKNSETKSKVMSLGNRLAPRMGGNRSAAFVRAWQIVKAGGLELAVKGTSFGTRQTALKRLANYAPDQIRAVLVPEPSNPVDPAAVAVMVGVQGGKGLYRLGYVPREIAPVVTALRGKLPALRVVSGSWGWPGKKTFGARITLAA